jgi:hypothetical protein
VDDDGDDVIKGTKKRDVICADEGNVIYGLGGNDVLFGGPGQEDVYGGKGTDEARRSAPLRVDHDPDRVALLGSQAPDAVRHLAERKDLADRLPEVETPRSQEPHQVVVVSLGVPQVTQDGE